MREHGHRKTPHRIRWSTVRIFQGREQRRYLAIVRLSRKGSVGQEVIWISSPCPGGVTIQRSAAWVCGLDYSRRRPSILRRMLLNRAQGSRPIPFHPILADGTSSLYPLWEISFNRR